MSRNIRDLYSDTAPVEGRKSLALFPADTENRHMSWDSSDFSLTGKLIDNANNPAIRVKGTIYSTNRTPPTEGWIEVETIPVNQNCCAADLYLAGTRPLPCPKITCISRHPATANYLVAATSDSNLLLLDARLNFNLKVLLQTRLSAPVVALVCCGKRLLGLGKPPGQTVYIIDINFRRGSPPGFLPAGQMSLPVSLTALAENDSCSAWGLTCEGHIYAIQIPESPFTSPAYPFVIEKAIKPKCRLHHYRTISGQIICYLKGTCRAIKEKQLLRRKRSARKGTFTGFAYDGKYFWSIYQPCNANAPAILLLSTEGGKLVHSFGNRPEVLLSSLNYCHNNLLVLDLNQQQLHQYHPVDTMEPILGFSHSGRHPGYLGAGISKTGGIHDLCLLYTGGEGCNNIHRYDIDKLLPLVGYLTPEGTVKDHFMDGFLLLAQYSPLLNGRTFGTDLEGEPSRQEDWIALFEEYFLPEANLSALESCAEEIARRLNENKIKKIKVVLGIPTADPHCDDWDNKGFSLDSDAHRTEVTHWAVKELLVRWRKSNFKHLIMAGFYYITEQGTWNDPVLHFFPKLCHKYGVHSFAIPGITSSWITEFNRAGFDCVALQSSHAFGRPTDRPRFHLLKSAGRIAREFGMGMEIELPYNIAAKEERQKVRDYLHMAHIQGWAGAFKAYFQSYNLIKALAESKDPDCRRLYDDLYRVSRLSYRPIAQLPPVSGNKLPFDYRANWQEDHGNMFFRLNIEGYNGIVELSHLSEE